MSFFRISNPAAARRLFIGRSALALSGAAVALLAGRDAVAAKAGDPGAQDVRILNTALGAELEAIAAYQTGAESRLLDKSALDLAICRHDELPMVGTVDLTNELPFLELAS